MILILFWAVFGTAWCHERGSTLFQDIAYHQELLDKEIRDMLSSAVPPSIGSLYPRWNHSTIRNLPSDILCRIPLIRLRQMELELEPEFWSTLVRARPFDYLLLDRLLSLFRSSPNRIRFLQGLANGKTSGTNVLPAQTWTKIGRSLSGWWTNWNDLLQELFQQYDGPSFSSYRWLLELDPSAYEPCSQRLQTPKKQELCLAKNVEFIAGNEQKRNELAQSLLLDFHNLERSEQIFRFRFWNSALQATLNMETWANKIIPVEVSSHFMFALFPKQLERLWKQKHHETYEFDGERQAQIEEVSGALRFSELPILWLLSDIKMNRHPSHENFEIEIAKYLNITQQIMASKAHPSRGRLFNEEIDACLNGKSRNFQNDSPQLQAMLVERLCSMSMKDLERVPLVLLTTTPGLLNALGCLNPGQTLVITNKLSDQFPLAMPPFMWKHVLVEKFEVFQSDLSDSELLHFLQTTPISPEQEWIIYNRFQPLLLNNLTSKWFYELLLIPNPDGIFGLIAPSDLQPHIDKLLDDMKLWPIQKLTVLSKLPPVLASTLLSKIWHNPVDHGGKIAHHLIHGLACHHVNQIPLISIDRLATEFLARFRPGTWITPHQIITCSCLRERLQHFQRLSNQGTSLVTTQLEAISNLSPSSETDGEEELSASRQRGICLRRSHLFLPSDLSKTASVVPLEQPWHRLHLAKIFPYLTKRDVIKIGEMWKSFGVPLSLSLEDLIQFGPSISLLALERFQMVPEQRKNLSMALKAVIRESHHFQANDPKSCFSNDFKGEMDNLLGLYLRLTSLDGNSVNGSNRFISPSKRPGQIGTPATPTGTAQWPRKKRDMERVDLSTKAKCDFTNLTFTRELFNFTLKLAQLHLDSGLIRPVPHIGPLVMDVVEQRRTILQRVLNLSMKLSDKELYDEVTFELEDHEINPEQRALIEDAFNEIYIKAVKRLVVTANLFPKDMTPLSCRIADMDLFLIFPMTIMSQFYDREVWLEHRNYSMEEALGNELISDSNENETDSAVLAILYKGSKAYSSSLITTKELESAIDFVAKLYALVMAAYNKRLNSPSSSNWNLVGMSSKVEYRIATEKRIYLNRLKQIFELSDLRSDEIAPILQSRLQSEDQKALFQMENLRYQYRLIKSMIGIAKIKSNDLELDDLQGNDDALEIILDLFPEYQPTTFNSSTTTEAFSNLPKTWTISTTTMSTTISVEWKSTNLSSPPPIHQSNSGEILACSFGLLPNKICKKNSVYEDYPIILNHSLAKSSSGEFLDKDDLVIQSLYLTLIQLLNQKASTADVSKDDKVYIRLFMDKKKRNFLLFLKMKNASIEDVSGFEPHFLKQMLDISKALIQELELSPGDLGVEHALKHPIIQDLFRAYIFQGVKQNPELHDLMCENHLLETSCVSDRGNLNRSKIDQTNTRDQKVSKLYENVLNILEDREADGTLNTTMAHLVHKVKIRAQKNLQQSLSNVVSKNGDRNQIEPMKMLHTNVDPSDINELKSNLTDFKLKMAQYFIESLKLEPEDLGLNQSASRDESMRTAFRWYYAKLSMEQRRILFQIDAMFKQAKKTLKSKPLTRDQIHEIRTLQKKVNKDSVIVAQRYLKINATGQEKQVAKILGEMVKAGNLSDIVIDEVNEFALLQKVYIIMRLVQIIDISPEDFSPTLLEQIPQSYLNIMFGKHLEESQLEMPTRKQEEVTPAPKIITKGISSDANNDEEHVKSKTKRESERPEISHSLESSTLSNIAFFLYHRAVSIATFRKSKGQLSVETIQELNNILESQQKSIAERLRNLGTNGSLSSGDESQLGYVVLHGNLGLDQNEAINNEVIKIQLKTTKQIILLLNLEPQFFQVNSNFILTSGIKAYLFGKTPNFKSETNSYLNGVNVLYSDIRKVLTKFAHEGKLNSKQTITAKKIINDLNKETVAEMVHILEITRAELHPDNLIKLIQAKTSSETLTSDQQFQIKTVIYEKKLKAIQQFILLLELKQSDLRISGTVPDDLLTYIFNSDGLKALQEAESADVLQFGKLNQAQEDIYGVFCMSCFHRLYTQWKKDHNIDQNEEGTDADADNAPPPEKRILGGKEGDFIIKSLGFLNDDLNDIAVPIDDYDLPSTKFMRSLKSSENFPAARTDVGIILHMYQVTADMGGKMNLSEIQRRQFNELLDSQEEMIYSKLPGVIGNATYSVRADRFGIVVETKDIEEYRKKALEDFIFNFHLSMTKKMIHLLGLRKEDFDESLHIPPSVEEVLFAPMFQNITTKDLVSISTIYEYLKDTVQMRNNLGLMFNHEYEKATRTIEDMNRRIEDRFVPYLGQKTDNLALGKAYELLEGKVHNGEMSKEDLEQLKSDNFVDMVQSLKVVIQVLELQENDLPDFGSINFEIMNALFDSLTDSDQAFLELLHEQPKIKGELDMGKVERQLQALRNAVANGRSLGSSNEGRLADEEAQPIPSLDFNNPIINHAKDIDITPYLGHRRSKRYVIRPWVFSCEDLRSLGVKRAHLSAEIVGAMSLNEIRNCMDIIQNPGPLHVWQGVLRLFHLTHTEQIVLAKKVPELLAMLLETNVVDNKREFLTKLGRNFQFSSPDVCRKGHLFSSNDIEKNVPIPTSDLSSIPCVFFHPCASFARLLKGSSLSLPSVIVNGKNSSLLTLKNAREIPELKALYRANILYNSARTWECLVDETRDDYELWTPEDLWYDQLSSRLSDEDLSKICQSGAIEGLNTLEIDSELADMMIQREQCLQKLAPILRDRIIASHKASKQNMP